MGIDEPDEARFRRDHPRTPVLARQQNRTTDALLRFRAGRYALGVEWFRAVTHWSTGTTDADQVALSVMYRLCSSCASAAAWRGARRRMDEPQRRVRQGRVQCSRRGRWIGGRSWTWPPPRAAAPGWRQA